MTSLKKLQDSGVAEIRDETVSLFRNETTGELRADLWSQPGIPAPSGVEVEIGGYYSRYNGPVWCVKLHWGRWVVAREELPRLLRAAEEKGDV